MTKLLTAVGLLAVALTVAASPASAAHRTRHPGYEAQAQAIDPGESGPLTPARERALRDCSALGNRFLQKDWGVQQDEEMDACMVEHGQMQ